MVGDAVFGPGKPEPAPDRRTAGWRKAVLGAASWVMGRPVGPPAVDDPVAAGQLIVGEYCYGWPTVRAYPGDRAKAILGSYCATAADVEVFVGGNHRTDWVSTYPFRILFGLPDAYEDGAPGTDGDVVIGHDVWIGKGATILSGVHIGDGAVVGAKAVVAGDVRPYAVVVGNPGREVRRRFTDAQVDALLRIAWWDWPVEQILSTVPLLSSTNVDEFIAKFDTLDEQSRRHA